ncbi:MAG TPA: restriction endonuclease [Streptosporangiaceae bacterium]
MAELQAHPPAVGVELLRPVQGHGGHRAIDRDQDRLVRRSHADALPGRRSARARPALSVTGPCRPEQGQPGWARPAAVAGGACPRCPETSHRFENLIRQLFEAMGMEVRVTQSSRDEGIDAVAYNKSDIVHRAEILIQAKRYSKCVPANDVRALAGSVEEKRATGGILVTTAWVGPESMAFAARNNRLRVIEGGELKHLLAEYLSLDVRIGLGRRPRRAT